MRSRIELQTAGAPQNGDPADVAWTTQATVWAEKMDPRGAERFVASQRAATADQAYRIRYRSMQRPDPTWRVKDGSEYWNVVAASEIAGRKEEIILLVSRLAPNERAA